MVYRAYRVPYEWVPQLNIPEEKEIIPLDVTKFRVENASIGEGTGKITTIEGVNPNKKIFTGGGAIEEGNTESTVNFCVATVEE